MGEILRRFKEEFQRLNGHIGVMDLEIILDEAKKDFQSRLLKEKDLNWIPEWFVKWLGTPYPFVSTGKI